MWKRWHAGNDISIFELHAGTPNKTTSGQRITNAWPSGLHTVTIVASNSKRLQIVG